ncbi:MAG TPA: acetylglutamate kinase [Kofleriaceae bacterium]
MSSPTQDVIVRLLENIGSRKEVQQYLRHYATEAPVAIVKVSGQVLEAQREALVSSLAFLHRVGLRPILLLGARPQLRRALAAAAIPTEIIDGLRVTPPEVLAIARRVFEIEAEGLAEALEALETRARPISSGVFRATPHRDARLGLVGEVAEVHAASVLSAIRLGQLPIVSPFGETAEGQILRLDADGLAPALAAAVTPHKIIYLTAAGGLVDTHGEIVSAVNLEEDFPAISATLADAGMVDKLGAIADMLSTLPRTSSVSITSPEHLARELFTHRGAGTLVRLGERVRAHDSFDTIDTVRLGDLLERCFGRHLADDYFTAKQPLRVYLADSYRATAILTREADVPYLDKFAVTTEAQGEGIGGSIWERMMRDYPALFWRSRATNPINAWYAQKADGMYKTDRWTVFWCGLQGFPAIQACIERALALPATLRD